MKNQELVRCLSPLAHMRKSISLTLILLMLLPAVFGQESVANQVTKIGLGTKIELRLRNKQIMRGTRGPSSDAGFTFVDARAGGRQIAFDDVLSVKPLKSHTTRNALIVVGIAAAAVGITAGMIFRCGPLGCGKKL